MYNTSANFQYKCIHTRSSDTRELFQLDFGQDAAEVWRVSVQSALCTGAIHQTEAGRLVNTADDCATAESDAAIETGQDQNIEKNTKFARDVHVDQLSSQETDTSTQDLFDATGFVRCIFHILTGWSCWMLNPPKRRSWDGSKRRTGSGGFFGDQKASRNGNF